MQCQRGVRTVVVVSYRVIATFVDSFQDGKKICFTVLRSVTD